MSSRNCSRSQYSAYVGRVVTEQSTVTANRGWFSDLRSGPEPETYRGGSAPVRGADLTLDTDIAASAGVDPGSIRCGTGLRQKHDESNAVKLALRDAIPYQNKDRTDHPIGFGGHILVGAA